MRREIMFLVAGVMAVATVGCKDKEACERSRLKLHRSWQSVNEGAARQKLMGAESLASDAERRAHLEQWEKIEKETALLESAFQTKQVTWNSADSALDNLQQLIRDAASQAQVFSLTVEQATGEYQAFEEDCR